MKKEKEYEPNEHRESQKSVQKKYEKLIHNVNTLDYYKTDLTNRFNCYVCSCGHITKTKDVDSGVTPFMFSCEKCGNTATSTFYKDIIPSEPHTIEWYRPTLKETLKLRKNFGLLEHVLNGGLLDKKV